MNKKKQASLLLSLLCLLLCCGMLLTACGKKGDGDGSETTTPTGTVAGSGEVNWVDTVPKADFGGRDFTILSAGYCNSWTEEVPGERISQAEYKRTLAFQERYNATVFTLGTDAATVFSGLQTTNMMGDTTYDLVFPHPTTSMAAMLSSGYFTNLAAINSMNFSNPWYNQDQVDAYTVNGKLYLLASDITINNQGFFALVYSTAVMAKYTFEETVDALVHDGRWTMEAMDEMLTIAETGAGSDPDTMTYGLLFNYAPIARWMYAMDENILVKNDSGSLSKGMNSKKMVNIANALYDLLYGHDESVLLEQFYNAGIPDSQVYNIFKGGRGLFMTWDVGSCYQFLRDIELDMGYAPLPKYDTEQDDYRVFCASGLMAIPQVTTSHEESGLAFEFFGAHSYTLLRPEFYEVILGGRLSDNPDDYAMLELLHSHKVFDYGYTLDENEDMIYILRQSVIINKQPDGIAVVLKSFTNKMDAIIEKAENIK